MHMFMRPVVRDILERLARATDFANTDNLGDALRLMQEHHLAEIESRQRLARERSACRLMQRPQQAGRRPPVVAERRGDTSLLVLAP